MTGNTKKTQFLGNLISTKYEFFLGTPYVWRRRQWWRCNGHSRWLWHVPGCIPCAHSFTRLVFNLIWCSEFYLREIDLIMIWSLTLGWEYSLRRREREKHAHFIKKVSDFFFTFEWSSRRQRTNPFRLRTKFLIIHPTLPTLRFSLNTRHDCEIEFLLTFCIYSGLETKKTGSGNNSPAIQQPTDKRRKVASVFREDDDEGNFLRLRTLITL